MTKRNLLLVSLLLVFGFGVAAPSALAQGNGTVINVAPSLYTLRPNSIADAAGQIYLKFSSGLGTIAGGEVFTITFSQPIVGASKISTMGYPAEFCDDSTATGIVGAFCSKMTYSASGNVLTLTNGTAPITGWTAGYITIYGVRIDTVGLLPGSYITASVGAVLNQNYPISFGTAGVTLSAPVNVGQVASTASGGTLTVSNPYGASGILTCYGSAGTYFYVDVAEQWAGAWTAWSDELTLAPYAPSPTGLATNGSDISITLSGIPEGVTVYIFDVYSTTTSTYPTISGVNQTTYTSLAPNSSTTFEFTLGATIRDEVEALEFAFVAYTTGAIAVNNPPLTSSVTLNPTTPAPGDYPAFTYPVGKLAEEPTYPLDEVDFIGCQTNLLYPYVTNEILGGTSAIANWDTALGVSNTTSDPFAIGSATPQNGSCTFYVYGAGTGSASASPTEATPITFTTPVILSGGTYGLMLSGTPAAGLPGGYAIAMCNFQNAVGFEQTVDNAGIGNWEVLSSFLAYVIPNPFLEPRTLDAFIGEFATTSYASWYCWYTGDCYYVVGATPSPSTRANPSLMKHKKGPSLLPKAQ